MIVPVVLSGGSGTRLWPLSTPQRPKQFLPLTGKDSLFRQTLDRVDGQQAYAAPIVVASAAHEDLCRAELAHLPGAELILEPIARNTAVAIVMAAALALRRSADALILVMPSDHRIGDLGAFHHAIARGAPAAQAGRLVTFGIQPDAPETGYGYLEAGEPLAIGEGVHAVARFTEKPDRATAEQMLAGGRHYWNGGIFLYGAQTFLEECRQLAPEIFASGTAAMEAADSDGNVYHPARAPLEDCPDTSVDYAVMERSDKVAMVPLAADWSDVGCWDALAELQGDHAEQSGAVASLDSNGCYVRSDGLKVALLGVEDLIVVATGDQVVIMRRGRSQDIKQLANMAQKG